jgi:hypothetical protein
MTPEMVKKMANAMEGPFVGLSKDPLNSTGSELTKVRLEEKVKGLPIFAPVKMDYFGDGFAENTAQAMVCLWRYFTTEVTACVSGIRMSLWGPYMI